MAAHPFPLVADEFQRAPSEPYALLRHGIPKIVLSYDKLMDSEEPKIYIPLAPRLKRSGRTADRSGESVREDVCKLVAEEFITITPSLNMGKSASYSTAK